MRNIREEKMDAQFKKKSSSADLRSNDFIVILDLLLEDGDPILKPGV